jgi:hypothetical protein
MTSMGKPRVFGAGLIALDGRPSHRFSWTCPRCGEWLPAFKAVTIEAADVVLPALKGASVFFLDRLSRATLNLAE